MAVPLVENGSAIVLAGGESRRMGREKALLEIAGRTLVEQMLGALRGLFPELVVSVAHSGPSPRLQRELTHFEREYDGEFRVVPDPEDGQGPLAGLGAALEATSHDLSLVLAIDTPHVFLPLIDLLWREAEGSEAGGCVPVFERRVQPLFAVYSRRVLGYIHKLLSIGDLKLCSLAESAAVRQLDLSGAAQRRALFPSAAASFDSAVFLRRLFQSLNTEADYEDWKRVAASFSVPQPNTETEP